MHFIRRDGSANMPASQHQHHPIQPDGKDYGRKLQGLYDPVRVQMGSSVEPREKLVESHILASVKKVKLFKMHNS